MIAPPHDVDVIAARISRAVRGLSQRRDSPGTGGFRASFDAFAFIDLVQALGQGLKSVRVELTRSTGEQAVVTMREGRMVHAVCGTLRGEDAVYRVITWEDDGAFTVVPIDEFPEANIHESNEGILMEGCRLLDESRV